MNHDLQCMRRCYDYMKESQRLVGYELTITLDQTKYNNWSQAEKNSFVQLQKVVEQSEPESFMIFQERHENGWSHYHGVVWYILGRSSHRCLWKQLNRKFGRSSVEPLRDGLIDHVEKKYTDWFDYCKKETGPNMIRYMSDILEVCTCLNKLPYHFRMFEDV